jgi:hypothetical protein
VSGLLLLLLLPRIGRHAEPVLIRHQVLLKVRDRGTSRHPSGAPLCTRWALPWGGDDPLLSPYVRATHEDTLRVCAYAPAGPSCAPAGPTGRRASYALDIDHVIIQVRATFTGPCTGARLSQAAGTQPTTGATRGRGAARLWAAPAPPAKETAAWSLLRLPPACRRP